MPSSPAPVSPFSAADAEAADVVGASSVRHGRPVLESLPPLPKPSSIKHLRVDQLRAELEALGLDDTSGLKRELQDRLLEAQLLKWHALFEQRDAALRAMIGKAKRKLYEHDMKIAYLADKVGLDLSGIDRQMERERDGVDSLDGSEEEVDGSGTVEEESEDGEE